MRNKYQEALDYVNKSVCTTMACLGIDDKKTREYLHTLQEIVDKEISKKVSEVKIPYSIEIPAYMVVKTCPKCNRKFDYKNMEVNYCSICGQHLDWSD